MSKTQQQPIGDATSPDNEAVQTPEPPPEEQRLRLSFDQVAFDRANRAAAELLGAVPEIRAVVTIVDYAGSLNDAPGIRRGVWRTASGKLGMAEIHGSLQNTFIMLDFMMTRAAELQQRLMDQSAAAAKQLVEQRAELERINAAIAVAKTTAAQEPAGQSPGGPAAGGPDPVQAPA